MPTDDRTDEFVVLVQRFMRVRPALLFQDESVANMRKQMQDLKNSGAVGHEDRMFLFRVLQLIVSGKTSPTMGELSGELGLPLSSATRIADGLVRAGFAERCDDPHDRRIVRLCGTKKGRQFMQTVMEFMKGRVTRLLRHFTADEQAQLLRLMSKLIDSIEAENEGAGNGAGK